jgi:DNA replication protein DnaC
MKTKQAATSELERNLQYLKLAYVPQHYNELAQEASQKELSHVEYLARLMAGEAALRHDRSIARRIQLARFPVVKTLDQFSWSWPKSINRLQVQDLFRLQFIADKANVIFLGGVGLGNYAKHSLM